jgi:hypothetical protein
MDQSYSLVQDWRSDVTVQFMITVHCTGRGGCDFKVACCMRVMENLNLRLSRLTQPIKKSKELFRSVRYLRRSLRLRNLSSDIFRHNSQHNIITLLLWHPRSLLLEVLVVYCFFHTSIGKLNLEKGFVQLGSITL